MQRLVISALFSGVLIAATASAQCHLYTFDGDKADTWFGYVTASDGYTDFVVASPLEGKAFVYSGKDATVLLTVPGFGRSVSAAGDVNKDGVPDLIVGGGTYKTGAATVVSGKDGKTLYTFLGTGAWSRFGQAVSDAGDVNRDGYADLLVGAAGDDNNGSTSGSVMVISTAALALTSDRHLLSLKRAGTQKLTLAAGVQHANKPYWIFGSATGIRPGVILNGVRIPLNPDAYTDFTFTAANSNLLKNFKGTLDGNGRATASFNVPAGLPPLIGFSLDHAFVVYKPQGPVLASNAVPILLRN